MSHTAFQPKLASLKPYCFSCENIFWMKEALPIDLGRRPFSSVRVILEIILVRHEAPSGDLPRVKP